jgi:hypothetical protein
MTDTDDHAQMRDLWKAKADEHIELIRYEAMRAAGLSDWQIRGVIGLRLRVERGEVNERTWEFNHLSFLRWLRKHKRVKR